MLTNLWNLLQGKKMYLVGIAMVVYGVLGLVLKYLTATEALPIIMQGLALVGLKSALNKRS